MSASMIACLSAAYAWSRKLTLAESGRSVRGIVPAPAGMLATRPVLAFGCAGDAGPPAYISYIPKTTGRVENAILAETTHAFFYPREVSRLCAVAANDCRIGVQYAAIDAAWYIKYFM